MNDGVFTDILGNKLSVGDICAYIKAERTGSSTVRKILHTGKITSIKNGGKFVFDDNITVYVSSDIVKLENPVIVRCKDCKWYRNGKLIEVMKFCYRMRDRDGEEVGYSWPEDGFCSFGERKEE